jgi:hypothetical protein
MISGVGTSSKIENDIKNGETLNWFKSSLHPHHKDQFNTHITSQQKTALHMDEGGHRKGDERVGEPSNLRNAKVSSINPQ